MRFGVIKVSKRRERINVNYDILQQQQSLLIF